MDMVDVIKKRYERGMEQHNAAMVQLRDAMLLSREECEMVIDCLNRELIADSTRVGRILRQALGTAMDIVRAEDALVKLGAKL